MQLPFFKKKEMDKYLSNLIRKQFKMKYIFIFITLLFSCNKDEMPRCTPYNLVAESSEDSARQKCSGLANSHPTFKVVSTNYVGCLNHEEYLQAKKAEANITMSYCPGVTYTIRITLK